MNKIILGDCKEEINNVEDSSIDLILIDPPYGIEYNDWNEIIFWGFLRNQFERVLKNRGALVIFQGWSNVCETLIEFRKSFFLQDWIIWDRMKGRGAKKKLMNTREDILVFSKSGEYTYNKEFSKIEKKTKGFGTKNGSKYRALSNIWTDTASIVPWSSEKLNHPTQKPLALVERLVRVYSNEGDVVLDCFAGSGTTGKACQNLKRDFLLIEKDEKYFNIIKNRVGL